MSNRELYANAYFQLEMEILASSVVVGFANYPVEKIVKKIAISMTSHGYCKEVSALIAELRTYKHFLVDEVEDIILCGNEEEEDLPELSGISYYEYLRCLCN
jgi:hypothetical protein